MRKLEVAATLVFLISIAGCGGGGTQSVQSTFTGQFSGPWEQSSDLQGESPISSGTITFAIADNGHVSGIFVQNTPQQKTGTVFGTVRNNGDLSFDVHFQNGITSYDGTVSKNGIDLQGPFSERGIGYGGFSPYMTLHPSDL